MTTVRYYNFIGLPGRIFFDGEYPDYCELFQPDTKTIERDNAVLLDMAEGPQSIEISESQFAAMVAKLQNAAD